MRIRVQAKSVLAAVRATNAIKPLKRGSSELIAPLAGGGTRGNEDEVPRFYDYDLDANSRMRGESHSTWGQLVKRLENITFTILSVRNERK
eukprot:tig00001006_g6222.t2